MLTLTNEQARRVVLHLQGLTRDPLRKLSDGALYDLIVQLGFVQVDSIQWVERAHHMTLYARNQTYRPRQLTRLLERDRLLFEHWTHDASIIPSAFFRYWKHRFKRKRLFTQAKFEKWQGGGFLHHCDDLRDRISKSGTLRSRDLERPDTGPQEMWQWHDGKAALEYLWHTGEIGIAGREGFQKVYAPIAECIPASEFDKTVSHDAFVDWACEAAIDRLGFGTAGDVARYFELITNTEAREWCDRALRDGRLIEIAVTDVSGKTRIMFARTDIERVVAELPDMPARMRALSPFDPVIRDRKRLEWLFGFEYRIEIYVPQAKRRWGYYVFPLLEGHNLIGRIDMRADRKVDRLLVQKLWLEPGFKLGSGRQARLDAELVRQARLAMVPQVEWMPDAQTDSL